MHYDYVTSDHLPLSAIIHLPHVVNTDLVDNRFSKSQPHRVVKWDSVDNLHRYQIATEELADDINLNLNVITCNNPSCDIQAHIQYTDALYNKSMSYILNASDKHISVRNNESKTYQIPGLNEVCTDLHNHARCCSLAWRQNNSPRSGSLLLEMKKLRSRFKLALGDCRSDKTRKTADSITNSLLSKIAKSSGKTLKLWQIVT